MMFDREFYAYLCRFRLVFIEFQVLLDLVRKSFSPTVFLVEVPFIDTKSIKHCMVVSKHIQNNYAEFSS